MNLRSVGLIGLLLALTANAQDATNLWLRYALRIPVSSTLIWHNEPDFRMQLTPDGGAFHQFLFRSELLWKPKAVHQFGIGMVGVRTSYRSLANAQEWRPTFTWFIRPEGMRNLMIRLRAEWREQTVNIDTEREGSITTFRCRSMVQYEIPFKREGGSMHSGIRTQAELLLRGYTDVDLNTFDQLRTSAGYVRQFGKALEVEGTWLWMFRDNGLVQQYLRFGVVHKLQRKTAVAKS